VSYYDKFNKKGENMFARYILTLTICTFLAYDAAASHRHDNLEESHLRKRLVILQPGKVTMQEENQPQQTCSTSYEIANCIGCILSHYSHSQTLANCTEGMFRGSDFIMGLACLKLSYMTCGSYSGHSYNQEWLLNSIVADVIGYATCYSAGCVLHSTRKAAVGCVYPLCYHSAKYLNLTNCTKGLADGFREGIIDAKISAEAQKILKSKSCVWCSDVRAARNTARKKILEQESSPPAKQHMDE